MKFIRMSLISLLLLTACFFWYASQRCEDLKNQMYANYGAGRIWEALDDANRRLGYANWFFPSAKAESLHDVGMVLMSLHQSEKGAGFFMLAKTQYEIQDGMYSEGAARSLDNLGLLYEGIEQFPAALDSSKKALEIYEKIYGNDNVDTIIARHNLSRKLASSKDCAAAQQSYEAALQTAKKILPADSEIFNHLTATQAEILKCQGKDGDAAAAFIHAVERLSTQAVDNEAYFQTIFELLQKEKQFDRLSLFLTSQRDRIRKKYGVYSWYLDINSSQLIKNHAAILFEQEGQGSPLGQILMKVSDLKGNSLRTGAIAELIKLQDTRAIPDLIYLLSDSSAEVVEMATYAIATFGKAAEAAVPQLAALVGRSQPVAVAAIYALGKVGNSAVLPILEVNLWMANLTNSTYTVYGGKNLWREAAREAVKTISPVLGATFSTLDHEPESPYFAELGQINPFEDILLQAMVETDSFLTYLKNKLKRNAPVRGFFGCTV